MADGVDPDLRGFDSYELKLGDELRGERASKGKSLLDVQRDLRIRAEYIAAIENADSNAFPNDGFAAGYIRSYARYLDLDADDVYNRFCEESGFEGFAPQTSVEPTFGNESKPASSTRSVDDLVVSTRFAPANARAARIDLGASIRGVASVAVLFALVGGLGFGGWTVLQNLQRVGFAPLPTAPEVVVSAPDIFSAEPVEAVKASAAQTDSERQTLAEFYAEQEISAPTFEPRDGPIASIDPDDAGIYAPPSPEPAIQIVSDIDAPKTDAEFDAEIASALADAVAEVAARDETVNVYATAEAWVRVSDATSRVLFTGILAKGDRFVLPDEAAAPILRAGNAGSVYLGVGADVFGPLGEGPVVAKNVRLTPEAIRESYPVARDVDLPPLQHAQADELQKAEMAALPQE